MVPKELSSEDEDRYRPTELRLCGWMSTGAEGGMGLGGA